MQRPVPIAGASVWIRQTRWRVERVQRDGAVSRLEVAARDRRRTFLMPFDRPRSIVVNDRFARVGVRHATARLAGLIARHGSERRLSSAVRARIDILPHQLEPVLAALSGARRILIADEVGLGKTVQAALIAAELRLREPPLRVLLLVPASLRAQWIDELHSRFELSCIPADADAIARVVRLGPRGDNPWHGPALWITSLDYLKQPHVLATLPPRLWDLVIVDEAHGACGDSGRHAAADLIARRSRHVVLLTATPHSGDVASFNRLLDLGRLAGIPDDLLIFRRTRNDVGIAAIRRIHWHHVRLTADEARLLDALTSFERKVLAIAGEEKRGAALLLLSVFRKRALSTSAALAASIDRRLMWLDASGRHEPEWQQRVLDFVTEDDARENGALEGDIGFDSTSERAWLRQLRDLARTAARCDSKISRLQTFARRTLEPIVIFTEFRDSLAAVARALESIRPIAVVHGGLTADEQHRELSRFTGGLASLLLATDVASVGLNLQSRSRWVISLELPWNPVRLEQRAGRVDRIGQTRRVHVTLLVARHPAESGILTRLAQRALSARRTLGPTILPDAIPNEDALRAHLLASADLIKPDGAATNIAICRTWTRAARRVARGLLRRRLLASHWRARTEDAGRTRMTVVRGRPHLRAELDHGSLFVFSVPIVDASGRAIERHVVATRAQVDTLAAAAAIVGSARSTAAAALRMRLMRASRRWLTLAGILGRREQALFGEYIAALDVAEQQHGLFDHRTEQTISARYSDREELQQALEKRLDDLRERTSLGVGRPILELLFLDQR